MIFLLLLYFFLKLMMQGNPTVVYWCLCHVCIVLYIDLHFPPVLIIAYLCCVLRFIDLWLPSHSFWFIGWGRGNRVTIAKGAGTLSLNRLVAHVPCRGIDTLIYGLQMVTFSHGCLDFYIIDHSRKI